MATFIWDPAVQWPPPAHILLNYDVVAPGGVLLSRARVGSTRDNPEETTMQPYLALITPLGGGSGGHPDQGLPQPPVYPSQGLPGYQPYPDQGLPGGQGGRPSQPIYHPGHPDHGLPAYPDQGLPGGSGGRPDQGLPPFPSQGLPPSTLPPGGSEVPEDVYTPAPIPEEIASQYVVSVYNPKTMEWTTKSYPPR